MARYRFEPRRSRMAPTMVNASSEMATGAKTAVLAGVKVLELGGLAPVPYCGIILTDWGADVVRVDPPKRVSPLNSLCSDLIQPH